MKNVSKGKVTSGYGAKPSVASRAPASGGPRMPNVGGHTSNITPSQGVQVGRGKGGC
jgi:hypothetical protein